MDPAPQTALDTGSTPELSVVVPVYDEAPTLLANVEALLAWLRASGLDFELLLVDDGSRDGSGDLIDDLATRHPRVGALHQHPNQGRGRALGLGIRAARGSVILTTEADGSWGMECLQRLVDLVRSGAADLAVASPYLPGGGLEGVPAGRAWFSRAANLLIRAALAGRITMATGMCRAYTRTAAERVLSARPGKDFHLDVLLRALRAGLHVVEVPAVLSWRPAAGRPRRALSARWLAGSSARHLLLLAAHLAALARSR